MFAGLTERYESARDAVVEALQNAGDLWPLIRDYADNAPAYLQAAWETAQYFNEPKIVAGAAALALIVLALRVFVGGIGGALLRFGVYAGIAAAIATNEDFLAVFADQPQVAPLIAALLVIGAWLPLTLLGGFIRLLRGRRQTPIPVAARSGGEAGEAFNVRRNEKENKQIIVIMMTDIVGYSARMEKDETATYALLKEHNIIMRKAITTNRGREIKTIGDAFMVVFITPIDALRCAIAMQKGLYAFNKPRAVNDHLKVRIGLFQGEAVVTEKDVFGEAVNIAARMESITDPGGISCSAEIYEAVKGKVDVGFQSIGIPKMKNIAKPPEVYRVHVAHT